MSLPVPRLNQCRRRRRAARSAAPYSSGKQSGAPRLLSTSQGLLTDAVICGEGGDRVTAMVWLHPDHVGRVDGEGVAEASLRAELVA